MMKGDFQKSLQLLVAYGYCVFEEDACVNLSGVLDRKPNYDNALFSKLFTRPCIGWPGIMNEGLSYATALLSELCVGASCPPVSASFGVAAV